MKITKSCGYVVENRLDDLRFTVKKMASILALRKLPAGRFPMRQVTEKVREGTVTATELSKWYPKAAELLREGV